MERWGIRKTGNVFEVWGRLLQFSVECETGDDAKVVLEACKSLYEQQPCKVSVESLALALRELHCFAVPTENYRHAERARKAFATAEKLLRELEK